MIKQDYITIKELEVKLEKSNINLLISYVDKALSYMEIMNANEIDKL